MKKTAKIGILVSGLPPLKIGGTEIATDRMARHLAERGYEVHIFTRNVRFMLKGKKRTLATYEFKNGVNIHRFPCSSVPLFRSITHLLFGLRSLIAVKPDIIHGQQLIPNGLVAVLAGKLYKKKSVVHARGSELYKTPRPILKSIVQYVITRAHLVLSVSQEMTHWMKQLWPQIPIHTIPNGIEVRKDFHIKEGKSSVEVIYVGRLVKEKNIPEALKIIAILKRKDLLVTLSIIGSGPEEAYLKQLCRDLNLGNSVKFYGKIPHHQVLHYLLNADVFIFPTRGEGLPNAVLEAMAAGLPILAARRSGLRELVRDGVNGYLYPLGERSVAATRLQTLIENREKCNAMGIESRRFAEKYNWTGIIQHLLVLYHRRND
ncbi:MAG: glycosyltransferase family 4 protein [Promethearchaeota archaeon]|nr:MAG: glycosyltransferase family 4 protein [Candidatus Lokiarchaeota archaeon]